MLTFGNSAEPAPEKRAIPLHDRRLDAAAEDAGLGSGFWRRPCHPPDRPGGRKLDADPDQLHRILVNLLRNAREAIAGVDGREGRSGTDRRRACGSEDVRPTSCAWPTTVPGLPERARAHLFEPFAGSTRRGGAGLGLAIARELAKGHGGDLTLVRNGADRERCSRCDCRRDPVAARMVRLGITPPEADSP